MFADYGESLKKLAGPTIEFLGEVDEEKKAELYVGCKAFIFPAEEEDFGIMPVEAMSFGKPVIALRQGGVLETVVEGKTGVFLTAPKLLKGFWDQEGQRSRDRFFQRENPARRDR